MLLKVNLRNFLEAQSLKNKQSTCKYWSQIVAIPSPRNCLKLKIGA